MSVKGLIYWLYSLVGKVVGIVESPFIKTQRVLTSARTSFRTTRLQRRFSHLGKGSTLGKDMVILNPQDISVGHHTNFQRGCAIESWHLPYMKQYGNMFVGDDCNFGEYTHITTINRVEIGNGVLTGRFVLITDNSHGKEDYSDFDLAPGKREVTSKGPTIIEDNVWLGDKVAVLSGVRVGKGAVIAANAVVTKDIPPYTIAAGVPARVIKEIHTKYEAGH